MKTATAARLPSRCSSLMRERWFADAAVHMKTVPIATAGEGRAAWPALERRAPLDAPRHPAAAQPAAALALHPPALVPEEVPLLRFQFARMECHVSAPGQAAARAGLTSMRCAPTWPAALPLIWGRPCAQRLHRWRHARACFRPRPSTDCSAMCAPWCGSTPMPRSRSRPTPAPSRKTDLKRSGRRA